MHIGEPLWTSVSSDFSRHYTFEQITSAICSFVRGTIGMNANLLDPKTSVKVIGSSGQISLGKEYAGRQVLIEEREPGVWLVRTALVIPENEAWLHAPQAQHDLQEALAWAQANPPRESDPDVLFKELGNAQEKRRSRKGGSQ